jgi:glutaredoxin
MKKPIELYTTSTCEHCAAAREDFEWRGIEFVEYDVELDAEAFRRLQQLTGGTQTVPVIVEEGKPIQIGWMGRGCSVGMRSEAP